MAWPKLHDGTVKYKEVEQFFVRIEEIFELTNDGKGMNDRERLIALRCNLEGSRKIIFENIWNQGIDSKRNEKEPKGVYEDVKRRLMQFQPTATQVLLEARRRFEDLRKGRQTTAMHFEAQWEKALAELIRVGMKPHPQELFISYIGKIGRENATEVLKDKRMRDDGHGSAVNRPAKTWEEAHEVLVELENLHAETSAMSSSGNRLGALAGGLGDGKVHRCLGPKQRRCGPTTMMKMLKGPASN